MFASLLDDDVFQSKESEHRSAPGFRKKISKIIQHLWGTFHATSPIVRSKARKHHFEESFEQMLTTPITYHITNRNWNSTAKTTTNSCAYLAWFDSIKGVKWIHLCRVCAYTNSIMKIRDDIEIHGKMIYNNVSSAGQYCLHILLLRLRPHAC